MKLPKLTQLANLEPDQFRINLRTKSRNERLDRSLDYVIQLSRELLRALEDPSIFEPLEQDIGDLLSMLGQPGRGLREPSDGGKELFSHVDRVRARLDAIAASKNLTPRMVQGTIELERTKSLDSVETTERLNRLEDHVEELYDQTPESVREELEEALDELKSRRAQVRRLVEGASKDATKLKVGDYHKLFEQAAERHRAGAQKWLWAAISLVCLTALAAVGSVFQAYFYPVPRGQQLELAVGKAVVVGLLFTAALWAGRNYRSHTHNAVVNEHRKDSLGTFDAFWGSASRDEARDALLVQVSNAIYLPTETGFHGQKETEQTTLGLLAGMASQNSGKGQG